MISLQTLGWIVSILALTVPFVIALVKALMREYQSFRHN